VADEQHAARAHLVDASAKELGIASERCIDLDHAARRVVVDQRDREERGAAPGCPVDQDVIEPRVPRETLRDKCVELLRNPRGAEEVAQAMHLEQGCVATLCA
jgi:hypothetical protein